MKTVTAAFHQQTNRPTNEPTNLMS